MIVTGEASGDMHGANLVKAMRQRNPLLSFAGMGGEEMQAAGVRLLFDAGRVSVVGIAEVISHLPDILRAQRVLRRYLAEERPDLLIIIDLPDFNLLLAGCAKKLGIPVYYYICPQVWAWRSGRVRTIRERVDGVGVILPFEEQFLRERGVDANYVGHPLLDTVRLTRDKEQFRQHFGIEQEQRCVGLLPGSRKKEVASLLPAFLAAAERLQQRAEEDLVFLIPLASTITEQDLFHNGLERYRQNLDIRIIQGERYNLMASCDCVVAASGTVTLELALLDVPMVVAYRLSPLTYFLGKILVKLPYFSLVNLIAGKQVVPELLQHQAEPETIARLLYNLMYVPDERTAMLQGLRLVRVRLGGGEGASARAAELALQILSGGR